MIPSLQINARYINIIYIYSGSLDIKIVIFPYVHQYNGNTIGQSDRVIYLRVSLGLYFCRMFFFLMHMYCVLFYIRFHYYLYHFGSCNRLFAYTCICVWRIN